MDQTTQTPEPLKGTLTVTITIKSLDHGDPEGLDVIADVIGRAVEEAFCEQLNAAGDADAIDEEGEERAMWIESMRIKHEESGEQWAVSR